MSRDADEVLVGGQQRQLVAQAELRQDRVDGSNLEPGPPAPIAQLRRFDVVLAIRRQQWKRCEAFDDLLACTRSGEPLQEILQHQARRHDSLTAFKSSLEHVDLGRRLDCVAPKRK